MLNKEHLQRVRVQRLSSENQDENNMVSYNNYWILLVNLFLLPLNFFRLLTTLLSSFFCSLLYHKPLENNTIGSANQNLKIISLYFSSAKNRIIMYRTNEQHLLFIH